MRSAPPRLYGRIHDPFDMDQKARWEANVPSSASAPSLRTAAYTAKTCSRRLAKATRIHNGLSAREALS
jgi:hypothetical protein